MQVRQGTSMISHREGNGDRAVCLAKTVPVDPCADHFCRDPLGVKAAEHLALLSESICQSASALTTERVDKLTTETGPSQVQTSPQSFEANERPQKRRCTVGSPPLRVQTAEQQECRKATDLSQCPVSGAGHELGESAIVTPSPQPERAPPNTAFYPQTTDEECSYSTSLTYDESGSDSDGSFGTPPPPRTYYPRDFDNEE